MNARQQLKPKTIRLAILLALADGAITTIDDLQIKTDEPRKKVAGAVYPAAIEKLIRRMRDDVTGAPAYQITADGRKYLAKYSGGVDEPAGPAIKESLTTESGTAIATKDAAATAKDSRVVDPVDEAARQHHEAVALGVLETTMPGFSAEVIAQKDVEITRLTGELAEAKASLELNRMAHAVTPAGYVTQRPGKPLARFTKAENAQARAMSSALAGKRAQVFALVPVGVAIPGAEWVKA